MPLVRFVCVSLVLAVFVLDVGVDVGAGVAYAKPPSKKPTAAPAEPKRYTGVENEDLRLALVAFDETDYLRAMELLEKAKAQPTLTKTEKVILFRTFALTHVALGESDQARRDFENLLREDPTYELDKTFAANVRDIFDAAHASLALTGGGTTSLPVLSSKRSADAPRVGQAVTFTVLAPSGTAKVELQFRKRGEKEFSSTNVTPGQGGEAELTLPGLNVVRPAVEYVLRAVRADGEVIAADGSAATPMLLDVRAAKGKGGPKPWVWGAVAAGLVVVGGVAAGVAVALTRQPDTAQLSIIAH